MDKAVQDWLHLWYLFGLFHCHCVTHHNILEATFPPSGLHFPEEGNSCIPNVACYIATMESVQLNIRDNTRVKLLSKLYMIPSLKILSSLSLLMSVANHPVTLPARLESSKSPHTHYVPAHLLMRCGETQILHTTLPVWDTEHMTHSSLAHVCCMCCHEDLGLFLEQST